MTIASRFAKHLIPLDSVDNLIQIEPALLVYSLCIIAFIFYKLFLRDLSPQRHQSLRQNFKRLLAHGAVSLSLLSMYFILVKSESTVLERILPYLLPYLGLLALFWGALVFVKASRILVLQYLFFSHKREGVPIVLVNTFTLLFSTVVYGGLVKEIFNLSLAPVLATSAMVSILLGLALQDTLGNLFSGIALQFDKPFDIGDWVEVIQGLQKWVGQVEEISWRATVLIGLSDELIIVPNRVIGQAQVSNFSSRSKPILRSQVFRIPYGASLEQARQAILKSVEEISEIARDPAPLVYVTESTESWVFVKLIYALNDYGHQWRVADRVIPSVLNGLNEVGIEVETNRMKFSVAPGNSPR